MIPPSLGLQSVATIRASLLPHCKAEHHHSSSGGGGKPGFASWSARQQSIGTAGPSGQPHLPGRHRQHRPSLPYGHPGQTDSPRPPARHAYGAWWRSPSTAVGLRDFSFILILARFMDLHIYSWLPSPLFYTYSWLILRS